MESKDNPENPPEGVNHKQAEDPPSVVTEDVIHGFHFPHAQVKLPQQKAP